MSQQRLLNEKLVIDLFESIKLNNIEKLHHILKNNININSIYKDTTALTFACREQNYQIICILIDEYKVNPFDKQIYQNNRITSPLHIAVMNYTEEITFKIIDKIMSVENADINFLDVHGQSVFLYSITYNNFNPIYKYLKNKYDISFNFPTFRENVILELIDCNNQYDFNEFIEFMMSNDESIINKRDTRNDYSGYTLLHHAVRKYNYQLIDILIKKYNIRVTPTNNGKYPIHLAVAYNNIGMVTYLSELGINLQVNNSPTSRLLYRLVRSEEIKKYFNHIAKLKFIARTHLNELLDIINNCHAELQMLAPIQWISGVSLQHLNYLSILTEKYVNDCLNYYSILKHKLINDTSLFANNIKNLFDKNLPFYQIIKQFLVLDDLIAHQNYFKILDISKPYYALKKTCPFH